MQQSSRFHLHIPYINNKEAQLGNQQEITVIGLIDASGSMSSSWKWLANFWNKSMPLNNLITITFSTTAQIVNNNKLSENIMLHGGSTTEIVSGFELLEKEINNIPLKNNITIIFISDGYDNNVNTIEQRIKQKLKGNSQKRNINFVCLGIGNSFPTFLSMNLRTLYHQGDPQIPTLYLIEHPSEQAFFNKFETMKQYFQTQKLLKLNKIVQLYPFDEEVTDSVYEGQWVFSKKQNVSLIEFPDLQITTINEKDLEIDDIINLFRFWVQGIQIKVLNKQENAQVKASICYEMAKKITDNLSQMLQVNVLQDKLKNQIDYDQHSFKQRAKVNYVANYGNRIIFYMNELKRLSDGVDFQQVNEFEAAKRLNIGTIVGKYQQKALALKGITVQEFKQIRDEFSLLIQNSKIQLENKQGQERSVISLENQRDIISQKDDILEGLNYIKTQFDFVEAFPLIGHSITVKRSEGSQINPWLISVTKFAKINKIIDSGLLIKNNFNVQINIGNQQQEDINCILPLFNKSDADMKQFIRSRMIKLLMTYIVQQNIEMFYEETYLALLSNALIYILKQEKSEWQQQILENIFETTKLAYEGTQQFEQYLDKFLNNPSIAIFEKETEYERFVSTSKPFIFLFYIMMKKDIAVDFEKEIEKLILHYFTVQMVEYKHNLSYFIRIVLEGQQGQKGQEGQEQQQLDEQFQQKVQEGQEYQQFNEQFQQEALKLHQNCEYFAKFQRELRELANNKFEKVMKQNDKILCSIEIINDRVYNDEVKLSLKVIENFYFLFAGKQFNKDKYLYLIYHAFTINQNELFNKPVNYDNLKEIKNEIFSGAEIDLPQIIQYDIEQLEKQYLKKFVETHMMIKPINFTTLKEECISRNIFFNTIKINYESRLSSNCCLAPQCPFYLQTDIDFYKHLQNWKGQMPMRFHHFVLEQIEEGNDYKKIMIACKKKWPQFPEKYNQDEDVVEQYIKMISESI